MCDRSELFSWCPVCDHWCLIFDQMFDQMETNFFRVCNYFLVLILNVTTIWCPMLQALSCLTMFCVHNFSMICKFNLQFSQNYINIYTTSSNINSAILYSHCEIKTLYMIGQTVAHFTIFSSSIKYLFLSVPYCFVYNYVKHIGLQPVYTWMYTQ